MTRRLSRVRKTYNRADRLVQTLERQLKRAREARSRAYTALLQSPFWAR